MFYANTIFYTLDIFCQKGVNQTKSRVKNVQLFIKSAVKNVDYRYNHLLMMSSTPPHKSCKNTQRVCRFLLRN